MAGNMACNMAQLLLDRFRQDHRKTALSSRLGYMALMATDSDEPGREQPWTFVLAPQEGVGTGQSAAGVARVRELVQVLEFGYYNIQEQKSIW